MHPQIRRDGPGKCPICAMDLVPVKKSAGGVRTVSISADVKKLMNIQTVPVQRRYVTADVRMVGKIDYDETKLAHITAWVSGRLDRLYVDYTGVEVKKGDHMVYIYSEELYTAQEELISALESKVEGTSSRFIEPLNLVESSREKLRLLGLTPEQIQEIEQRRKPTDHVTIYSPVGGIVIDKLKQEGDRVRTGRSNLHRRRPASAVGHVGCLRIRPGVAALRTRSGVLDRSVSRRSLQRSRRLH